MKANYTTFLIGGVTLKNSKLKLLIFIAIPLVIGGLAALISGGGMDTFDKMAKPPLSPPGWLFPVVWTILYILMGIASFLVYTSSAPKKSKKNALILYAIQLFVNFLWPILFFALQMCTAAAVLIVILWLLVLANLLYFYKIKQATGYLLIPYLLWVTFATYLNIAICVIN